MSSYGTRTHRELEQRHRARLAELAADLDDPARGRRLLSPSELVAWRHARPEGFEPGTVERVLSSRERFDPADPLDPDAPDPLGRRHP